MALLAARAFNKAREYLAAGALAAVRGKKNEDMDSNGPCFP